MNTYLSARVRLFSHRLWRREDFLALLSAPEDEVGPLLRGRGLGMLAPDGDAPSDRSLEHRIITQVLDEIWILLRALAGAEREFLLYWTRRWEISNLKALVRGKLTGERPAVLISRLIPLGPFGRLDGESLAHAEDVEELLRRLETGVYAPIVAQAREAFDQSHDAFLLDAALDRAYYEGLVERAKPLEAAPGQDFRALMGAYIDRINLVWLLRYRFNYRLPPAQVVYLLIQAHYDLPMARLKVLAAQPDLAGVLAALPEPLVGLLAGAQDIGSVAQRLEQRRLDLAEALAGPTWKSVASRGPGTFAQVFAYLILRERRLRDVRAVLRGRQLHLPRPAIEASLGALLAVRGGH